MPQEVYRKGQVMLALWRTFFIGNTTDPRRDTVPPVFAARVRKLQECGVPLAPDERPGSAGTDIDYELYHAFELAVGLTLCDGGLPRGHAAFLLRHIRRDLRRVLRRVLANPPSSNARILRKDRPASPALIFLPSADPRGLGDCERTAFADTTVFISFRYMELEEVWPDRHFDRAEAAEASARGPLFLEPKFHFGLLDLFQELARFEARTQDRMRSVIEIAHLAVLVRDNLRQAPKLRRGRS
jgi:hypothetical protein